MCFVRPMLSWMWLKLQFQTMKVFRFSWKMEVWIITCWHYLRTKCFYLTKHFQVKVMFLILIFFSFYNIRNKKCHSFWLNWQVFDYSIVYHRLINVYHGNKRLERFYVLLLPTFWHENLMNFQKIFVENSHKFNGELSRKSTRKFLYNPRMKYTYVLNGKLEIHFRIISEIFFLK